MRRGSGGKSASVGVMLIRALAVVGCAAFLVISFVIMVNAIAYLAGVGRPGTFTATGHSTVCSGSPTGSSCWTEVDGYVEPGNVSASWPGDVQIGDSFPVRLPLWDSGLGTPVLFNTGTAIFVAFIFGALQLFTWGGIGYAAYRTIRSRAPARGSTAGPTDVSDMSAE
jgi:hypothetical protein